MTLPEVYVVGDLLVDAGRQCVFRGELEIALPKLSFRLLMALIEAAPNVLSNEQLMQLVWPGLVVSPETINKRVNLLREALEDDAREPRYILGVRSRGYRLIPDVSTPADVIPPPAQIESAQPADDVVVPPRSRWSRRWLAVALTVLVVGAIATTWYWMRLRAQPPADTVAVNKVAVAVLPFESISADPADAYLASGLPEMIINRMSQSPFLTVIARNSSFALTTSAIDSHEIGRRLHCAFLVAGSVQRDADRLRVEVQVVDTAADTVVWSARFDRKLHEIFNVEDDIGDQVVEALATKIRGAKPKRLPKERSGNVEGYLAFLRGRSLLGRFTVRESQAAIPYFERAIELDPQFAPAYASLYDARMQAAEGHGDDLAALRERYRTLIDRALAIDPTCGAAYFARAMWSHDDPDKRKADFRRAVALDPSNGRGLTAYADFLENNDPGAMPDEADRMLQRALQIDPMSPLAHFKEAVWSTDETTVRTELRERKLLEVLERDPNFVPALQRYGRYRWLIDGRIAEGIQYEEHALAEDSQDAWTRHLVMTMYLDIGDEAAARDVVAGTPRSAQTAQLMLAFYAGDRRAAGVAAFDDTVFNRNPFEDWGAPEALRDYAMKSGELEKTTELMRQRYDLQGDVSRKLNLVNFRPALYVSQLLAAAGRTHEALEMRRIVSEWNKAHEATLGTVYARRLQAEISLLDGDRDGALKQLAESFQTGDYENWWYTLELDPLWLPLHDDPRFKDILADVRRYIGKQHEQLEELRRAGEVPRRPAPAVVQ